MSQAEFTPKYNVAAARIMFNRALESGDYDGAREIAEICISAQDGTETEGSHGTH